MNLIAGKLHVSTITAVARINCDIDLRLLFENIKIDDYVQYIQQGNDNYKGFSEKLLKKKRKNKTKTSFYNCCTIHINENMDIYCNCPRGLKEGDTFEKLIGGKKTKLTVNEMNGDNKFKINLDKIINVKIFNNGKVQITGLKYEGQGVGIIKNLIQIMKDNQIIEKHDVEMEDYRIVLINCDFELPHEIERYKLHEEITQNNYYSSYEPCSYPGVNIKYYINTTNDNGICNCETMCNGKGKGIGDGDCKRVTIAVFKSGSIIITGGQNVEQILKSYNFITDFIKGHDGIRKEISIN